MGSQSGLVAQWIARTPSEREVVGSSPIWVAFLLTHGKNPFMIGQTKIRLPASDQSKIDVEEQHFKFKNCENFELANNKQTLNLF